MADWIANGENGLSIRTKLNNLKTSVDSKAEASALTTIANTLANKVNLTSGKIAYSDLPADLMIDSFYAFCNAVNADSLDAAFGKNNESLIMQLGQQLYMYVKNFKADATNYTEIQKWDTLAQILANNDSYLEIYYSTYLKDLIAASPYATSKWTVPISDAQFSQILSKMVGASTTYSSFNALCSNTTDFQKLCRSTKAMEILKTNIQNPNVLPVKIMRQNATSNNFLNANRVILSTVGSSTYTVPTGVKTIHAMVIGGGGTGGTGGDGSAYYACGGGGGGAPGQNLFQAIDVTGGQVINYTVGAAAANSVFGTLTASHSYYSSQPNPDYFFCSIAGKGGDGATETNYSTYGAGGGGGGGYGGGGGGGGGRSRSSASTHGGGGQGGFGGFGGGGGLSAGGTGSDGGAGGYAAAASAMEFGTGGGGYGGAAARTGGAGGQGIIVLYLVY
jgi:hypothetical protein